MATPLAEAASHPGGAASGEASPAPAPASAGSAGPPPAPASASAAAAASAPAPASESVVAPPRPSFDEHATSIRHEKAAALISSSSLRRDAHAQAHHALLQALPCEA